MEILHTVQPIENLLNSKPAKASSGGYLLIKIRSYSTNILQISDSENKLSSSGPLQLWTEFWMIVQSDC